LGFNAGTTDKITSEYWENRGNVSPSSPRVEIAVGKPKASPSFSKKIFEQRIIAKHEYI